MIRVSKDQLLAYIKTASETYSGFCRFREFVLDFYYGEEEYLLCDKLDDVFTVLAPYFESEEAVGDDTYKERLQRLATFINNYGWSKEVFVSGLYYIDIKKLMNKYSSNLIDKSTLRRKINEITPVDFNPIKLLDLLAKIEHKS